MKVKLTLILLLITTIGFSQVIVPIERFTNDTIPKKKPLSNQFRDYVEWCKNRDTTYLIVTKRKLNGNK